MSSLILTRKDLFFRFAIFGLLLSFLFTPVGASDESVENSNGQAPEEINSGKQSQLAVRLAPVKTDHPRDTMRSFLDAMDDYREGVLARDPLKKARIEDAIRTLDVKSLAEVGRKKRAREAAVYLKEVIDRVIVIDDSKIPGDEVQNNAQFNRWRLKGTEIVISRIKEGEREGEFLFSASTVSRAADFFERVRDLPYVNSGGKGAAYATPWQKKVFAPWLKEKYVGFALWQWFGIFFGLLASLLVRVVGRLASRTIVVLAKRSSMSWDDHIAAAIQKPFEWILLGLFWMMVIQALRFEGPFLSAVLLIAQAVLSFGAVYLVYNMSELLVKSLDELSRRRGQAFDQDLLAMLHRFLKVIIVITGTLVAIQNLGINVMSVIAGLGIGGLAFALAAKDTAANLFGSAMIMIDRPFRVGDWIKLSGQEGTVERIGFRSTRLRTFYNSQISIPNSVVANAEIDNMGRRQFRRVLAKLGLTYDTPPAKVEEFVEGVKEVIRSNPSTRKDYFHVVFNEYEASALQVMVYFFLKVPDWTDELLQKEAINLEILKLAERIGVSFAFPTQSLHIESLPEVPNSHQSSSKEI